MPVCNTCNDTHRMTMYGASGAQNVMCTRCPLPCSSCSNGPPYCEQTPCSCNCHMNKPMSPDETLRLIARGRELQDKLKPRVEKMLQPISDYDRAKAEGAAEERARVVAWLRGPHACSGLVAWHESMPPIYDDIAHDIERGAHLEKP